MIKPGASLRPLMKNAEDKWSAKVNFIESSQAKINKIVDKIVNEIVNNFKILILLRTQYSRSLVNNFRILIGITYNVLSIQGDRRIFCKQFKQFTQFTQFTLKSTTMLSIVELHSDMMYTIFVIRVYYGLVVSIVTEWCVNDSRSTYHYCSSCRCSSIVRYLVIMTHWQQLDWIWNAGIDWVIGSSTTDNGFLK